MFKRKAFEKLKFWKEKKAPKYSVLLEGAKRVGKSTIAEEFAKQAIRGLPVLQIQGLKRNVIYAADVYQDLQVLS